jgi:YHS domain-containing protein
MKLEDYFRIKGTYELKDGVYNVKGSVTLIKQVKVDTLPIKFGIVSGYFYCSNNHLTSLEGVPKSVGGDFYCHENKLTTLEGCPKRVGGYFFCHDNNLTSLEGCPKRVGGHFICDKKLHDNLEYRKYLIMKELRK